MTMFITPKSLPNGASLSMSQLLTTLETPKPSRKERVVTTVNNNGWDKENLGTVEHFGIGASQPTLRTKNERKVKKGQSKGNNKKG